MSSLFTSRLTKRSAEERMRIIDELFMRFSSDVMSQPHQHGLDIVSTTLHVQKEAVVKREHLDSDDQVRTTK